MISKTNPANPQAEIYGGESYSRERKIFFEPVTSIYQVYTGKVERTQIRYYMTNGDSAHNSQPDDHVYEYSNIVRGKCDPNKTPYTTLLDNTKLHLKSDSYSGKSYYPTESKDYNAGVIDEKDETANNEKATRSATITTTGITRFIPTDVHYDKNNAMAFLLADVDDNEGRRPGESYVNQNFWAHLYDTPTGTENPHATGSTPPASTAENPNKPVGTENMENIVYDTSGWTTSGSSASDLSAASAANEEILYEINLCKITLENGYGELTPEQCDNIYNAAEDNLPAKESAEVNAALEKYKTNKYSKESIDNLLEKLGYLIEKIQENIDAIKKSEEPKQNTNDFDQMWADIGEDYSLTVSDSTNENEVNVEYDATNQQYIVGPFKIEYVERYTSDFTLASMAGDPILKVKINGNISTIKRSEGKWDFYYKGARTNAGIPQGYGYDNYPHNGEKFYIRLNYQDGINALLGLEVYFRYMQAESLWTRCEGEMEQLKWTVSVGYSACYTGDNCGNCDGGAKDIPGVCHNSYSRGYEGDKEDGYTHWHNADVKSGNHDMGEEPSKYCNNYIKIEHRYCPGTHPNSCNCDITDLNIPDTVDPSKYSLSYLREHYCGKNHGTHKCAGENCEVKNYTYECQGHPCGKNETIGAKKCAHGFYASHEESINLTIYGEYIESIDIQHIGTCHWAWRMYYDIAFNTSWEIDLTTRLEGDVWLDEVAQKANSIMENGTGIKESGEDGVENVLVTIKIYKYNEDGDAEYKRDAIIHDENGNLLSWPQKTDSSGHYKIDRIAPPAYSEYLAERREKQQESVNEYYRQHPAAPKLSYEEMEALVGGKVVEDDTGNVVIPTVQYDSNCFYVAEFQYDGQVYESTIFLRNGNGDDTAQQFMDSKGVGYADRSLAVENATERKDFDAKFTEIKGKDDMNGTTTNGQSSGVGNIKYNGKTETQDGVSMMKSEFESAATEDHENMRSNWENSYGEYNQKAYTYYTGSTESTGANSTEYKIMFPMSDRGINYGADKIVYTLNKNRPNGNKIGTKKYIDEYMLHINLGLQKRKETDISLLKDLYKITVVVNEQEIVKNYNCLGSTTSGKEAVNIKYNDTYQTMKKALEEERKAVTTNKLGLYKSDVSYNSKTRYADAIEQVKKLKENTELRVFATYAIRIYNDSDTNDVELNEIIDYYDDTYTLIDSENNGKMSDYGMMDDGIHASIVNDSMERTNKLVADKPYYRILSTTDSVGDISWKPTKQENLEGIANDKKGDLTWNTSGKTAGMNKSTTTTLSDKKLKVNEYVEIFTTYEIDFEGYKEMATNEAANINTRDALFSSDPHKNNIAEVSNYSTYYSERDDQDAISKGYYKPYKNSRQISGKIDKDSAPDNVPEGDILKIDNYEDDTCRAIPLEIALETEERKMYGYVFEDKKTKDAGKYNIKTGDGIYNGSDSLVPEVKISMFEVISLAEIMEGTAEVAYNDLEYYYEVPSAYYNEGVEVISKAAATGSGNYNINGYLPGDYILRFDYGTKTDGTTTLYSKDKNGNVQTENVATIKYNGQDYENTSFLSADGYSALNDKYLNLRKEDMKTASGEEGIKAIIYNTNTAYSVARDNEARRMVVDAFSRTIENDRGEILRDRRADDDLYVNAISMFAETPIMQIEINDPKEINTDTRVETAQGTEVIKTEDSLNIKNRQYHLNNINFGLEERAKTDIQLEEYIESILLIKNNELIFAVTMDENGNVIKESPNSRHLDKLTYMTRNEIPDKNQQGFYAISMEDDYLNGLTMKIDYRIKIMNKSETDFTGELSKYYVASEIVNKAKFSPTTEGYTEIINGWIRDEDAGLATNATLSEILRLSGAVAIPLTSQDESNIISGRISERDTVRPDTIVYGKYVGRFYYENKIDETAKTYTIKNYRRADAPNIEISYDGDKVVKTTVNQLINYIDVNASYDLSTQSYENSAWDLSGNVEDTGERKTVPSLDSIVSESSYREVNGVSNIYDEKDKALVTNVSSNIVISKNNKMEKFDTMSGDYTGSIPLGMNTYLTEELNNNWIEYREDCREVSAIDNTSLDVELVPSNYKADDSETEMWIMTTKTTSSDTDANDMSFDNLVEVLVYSNPTGRRDTHSVPGNGMVLGTKEGFWRAGYNSIATWAKPADEHNWIACPENDAYAPEFVTIIAPTGITLRNYIKNVVLPMTALIVVVVTMLGVFGVKQIKIRKEDMKD